MKEKHICKTIINLNSRAIITKMISGGEDDICECKAKYFEGGAWYCGRHAPSKVEERENRAYLKWKNR